MFRVLIAGLVMLGVVGLGGCKQGTETATEKAVEEAIEKDGGGKANVSVEEGKVSIETKDGSFAVATGGGLKIPADFPLDVYLPKGGTVITAMTVPEGFAVTLQTSEARDEIVGQYTAEMKAQGWEEKVAMNMGESRMLTYSKDNDARTVNIVVANSEGVTQVQITTTSTPPAGSN